MGSGGPFLQRLSDLVRPAEQRKAAEQTRLLQEKNDIQSQRDALTAKGREAEAAGRSFLKASGTDQEAPVKKSLLGSGISG